MDVPAGRHTIQISNGSANRGDYFSASYNFVNYLDPEVAPLKACGMVGDGKVGIFYFYNQDYTWGNMSGGNPLATVPAFTCVLPGLQAGTYTLEIWAPSEGKKLSQQTVTATAGGLSVSLPAVTTDLALKILPAR